LIAAFNAGEWRSENLLLSVTGGTILLSVVKDANNHVHIMSFSFVSTENKENWKFHLARTKRDFPGIHVSLMDKDKGGGPAMDDYSLVSRNCARHLGNNMRRSNVPKATSHSKMIYMLAKATSWDEYNHIMTGMGLSNGDIGYEWINSKRHEFVAASFIQKNICCFGDSLSNAVEQTNSAIKPARTMSITKLIFALHNRAIRTFLNIKRDAVKCLTLETLLRL